MRRLILVRHGETDWNAAHRLQGAADIPLNDTGRAQARATAPLLAQLAPVTRIVSSDLSRARDTARIIADTMGAEVVTDPRLRERCYGVWEGMEESVRRSEHGEEHTRWERGLEPRVEGYEGHAAVAERALAAVAEHAHADGTHMLVAHGSTIRVLMCALLGLELGSRSIGTLGNARWAELHHTGDDASGHWVLRELNAVGDTVLA
ncbi:histidine phosphatase family protein [Demequina sp.]|uniref:histidine phosphatase family protein n=1 Tax=Demequina sp. TaxID=2050685 RepID=UPI0025C080E5|nr:histidine phosphatase family protein [Demequina sp.]